MKEKYEFSSKFGGTFATEAERDSWDAYREARIQASLQSSLLSKEEADKAINTLLARLQNVPHTVA